jgi:ATP-dependent helicase/nuclease subunit A
MDEKTLKNSVNLQKIASNPNNSAWVFASAGSGKTKILVDRVLRLLLDGVDARKILCITFTKIAAAEMQERINQVLAKWVNLSDDKLHEEIFEICEKNPSQEKINFARTLFAKVLDDDFEVKIQTIHAFCQNLVKIFPFEIGISPNFEILDEYLEKNLLIKSRREIFSLAKFDTNLQEIIKKISSRLSEEGFLELISKMLNEKEKLTFLKIKFFDIDNLVAQIFKNLGAFEDKNEEKIFQEFLDNFDISSIKNLLKNLDNASKKTDLSFKNNLEEFLQDLKFEKIFLLNEVFLTKKGELKKILITKEFEDQKEFALLLQQKFYDFKDDLNSFEIATSSALLLRFCDKILQNYQDLKKQNSLLDYNDLIIKVNQLLENNEHKEWVKFRMDGFFDHILIDESQDTNHRQWSIIKALTDDFFCGMSASEKKRSIFIVGDDKQSIYGFQGAKAGISREIFEFYHQKNPFLKKVELQNSFRSLPKILEFVDAIFLKNNFLQKSDYQAHKAIKSGQGIVEIWPRIEAKKNEKEDEIKWKNFAINGEDEEFCQKQEMAKKITQKILLWVKEEKRVEFKDVMILLRKRQGGFNKILQREFQENLIPFKGVKKIRFGDNLLIQDLLALARFAALPEDDLNLACLLKSPFFALSEEELFELCVAKNSSQISLNESIFQGKNDILREKLQKIRDLSLKINIFEFYSNVIDEDVKKSFLLEFGEDSLIIIEQFLLEVFAFCQKNLPNLEKFLNYVELMDPEISLTDNDSNQVLISTIHSAKGLQSKIVILPDCCFNFNKGKVSSEKLIWLDSFDENYGDFSLPLWLTSKNEIVKNANERRIQELKEEYWRLFYVALTRAENEIYISGFGPDNDSDSWYEVSLGAVS